MRRRVRERMAAVNMVDMAMVAVIRADTVRVGGVVGAVKRFHFPR